jgi:peptidoglycan hydrolase-like protein with peptidoglycan-binding domain
MSGHTVLKIAAGVVFLGAFVLQAPAFGASRSRARARQTAAAQTGASKDTGSVTINPGAKKVAPKPRVIRRRKPRPRVQMAPTPARISEIQTALATQGAYKAQPNGKWDTATIQAMRDFQASHALTVTGKLDAPTLQKLGLGSEVAGRAAPLPLEQTPTAANPSAASPSAVNPAVVNPTTAQQQTP